MTEQRRVILSTGITMNVALAGPKDAPPVILLHGFPESHRTWRAVAPILEQKHRLVMPDLRGFGQTDRPQQVDAYSTETVVADLYALADSMGYDRFALVGHDWGGAIAWAAALSETVGERSRITRLAIVNSPHPAIFQRSLIEHPAQRAASQYMNAFRNPAMEAAIGAMGLGTFFDKSFAGHVDLDSIPAAERQAYLDDWGRPGALTSMLNWYRASRIVVPRPGEQTEVPDWVAHVPIIRVPTLVVWGMRDRALLPIQLDGLGQHVADLEVVRVEEAGHFLPWEAPSPLAAALQGFLD